MLGFAAPAQAMDYGQHGAVFPVIEVDLLKSIQNRLAGLQASGAIERMNNEFARRSEEHVRRPGAVVGIGLATRPRSWAFDPAITIDHDVFDTKGNAIARAGQRVSPLDFVTMRQALVFIDGDEEEQIDWALKRYDEGNAKIVLIKGAPLDLMTRFQRRFYFDQGGYLTTRFGIEAVPAVVSQDGRLLKISEIPVGIGRK